MANPALLALLFLAPVSLVATICLLARIHRRRYPTENYALRLIRPPDPEVIHHKIQAAMTCEEVQRIFPIVEYNIWKSQRTQDNKVEGSERKEESPGSESQTCAICVDQFDASEKIRPLTCGHIFHPACIDLWLTKRQACCPLCKTVFVGRDMPQMPATAVIANERPPIPP
ncbi:hypothetical protein EYZ11_006691 [Aspergillus tanneri]|uniref:RING-type domain-containing protein n=1 Tax=Aspergillus tanneri TaxID=1220188 RepID=A0A4S3JEV6_9EURO|nr:uncharacterized protein ATNIH1004_009382 [Aspergillus tanneri]KAA8645165.1 hypothetical protein ATNIH1004_009382 [Aspergillus tanneri]THC93839.1 hypothetical protein EYZ11_006691 [Aspergillus tanneri]